MPYALDIDLEQQRIARNRKIAEAMLAQSMQPMGGTETVGGIAVRRSPLEGIAKIAQAYVGQKGAQAADTEARALGQTQRDQVAAAMADFQRRSAGTPASSEQVVDEQANGGEGAPAQINAPAVPGDRRAAAMELMSKIGGDPRDTAKMMVAQAMAGGSGSMGKVDPKDYTPQSIRAFGESGDYSVLVPRVKSEFVNGQAVDPYATAPGTVVPQPPTEIERELLAAGLVKGSPAWNKAMSDRVAKQTTHQPPVTNVTVNTEKQFLGQIGEKLGSDVANAAEKARGAVGTITTVNQIRSALDSGKVMAGPGASARVVVGQLGHVLGVTGNDDNERLLKTRQVIQGLAQLELDAAQQMKGQGAITESERAIIRRAASGDIDSMTVPELRTLTDVLDRSARFKIGQNASNVQRLEKTPGASSMVEFMRVPEPPKYERKAAAPAINADTQRLLDQYAPVVP